MSEPLPRISLEEVIRMLGVDEGFVVSLQREGIITTAPYGDYTPSLFERIRICGGLHHDLGVNFAGLEVALRLLDTIHAQRAQFHQVLAQLRQRRPGAP